VATIIIKCYENLTHLCYAINFIFPSAKNPKLGFLRVDKGVSVPVIRS